MAAPSSVSQRFSLCPIESNGNENFKVIQNPGLFPDHSQNWITGSFCHSRLSHKISERSVRNFLSYLANTQTDRQTNKRTKSGKNITSLAEVKINTISVRWHRSVSVDNSHRELLACLFLRTAIALGRRQSINRPAPHVIQMARIQSTESNSESACTCGTLTSFTAQRYCAFCGDIAMLKSPPRRIIIIIRQWRMRP